MPWFPVIDYDRCVNCLQCVSFCLFGVYQKGADGKITVQRPHKCKTYCPACSRVCPRGAIMFPKHPQATINGTEIPKRTDSLNPTNVLEGLVKGDVYETLRRRQAGDAMSSGPGKANPADDAGPVTDTIPSSMLESLVQKHMQRLAHDAKPDQEQR
jgi:NAD-dependent dihydropyrimidine dehydrogenase PreA subunit